MTPEVKSRIEDEVRRLATQLNISDAQKAQLKTAFEDAEDNLDQGDDWQKVRGSLREQATKILTPQQLAKWDAEIAKLKSFLGHNLRL
jgi:hypothetical protein